MPLYRNASYDPNRKPAAEPTPAPIMAPYFILRRHSRRSEFIVLRFEISKGFEIRRVKTTYSIRTEGGVKVLAADVRSDHLSRI
jgi:hypothetical protein